MKIFINTSLIFYGPFVYIRLNSLTVAFMIVYRAEKYSRKWLL